jgi:fibro-slime domain-containing protein
MSTHVNEPTESTPSTVAVRSGHRSSARARLVVTALIALGAVVALKASSTVGTGSSVSATQENPPPNILFLLDLSQTMNENCCNGMPCLEDVKKDIEAIRKHNDWVNIGVIGTTSTADSYFPIAGLGSSPAELAQALSTVTVNPSNTRNFGTALWAATWQYFRYGIFTPGSDPSLPIISAAQKTHVITITKGLPNNDANAYDDVAQYLVTADTQLELSGIQNIVTHTIEIGGLDQSDTFSNASKATNREGLYLTPVTNEEVVGAITEILRHIRTEQEIRSVALVNTDDGKAYATQYTLEQDSTLPVGDLLQYQLDMDPNSSTFGQILYDESSPYNGALWSAGSLLEARHPISGETNGSNTRKIYTYSERLASCLPSGSTLALSAESTRRMDFDASFAAALDGSDCLGLFLQPTTYTPCTTGDYAVTVSNPGGTTHDLSNVTAVSNTTGVCDAQFIGVPASTAQVTCTKSITKVVLAYDTGITSQTFNVSSKVMQGDYASTNGHVIKTATVTASGNKTQEFTNPCYPNGCPGDTLSLTGTIRDFTPATNSDFEYTIADDKNIVESTLGSDRKPVFHAASHGTVHGSGTFNKWYTDNSKVIPYTLTLQRTGGNTFHYANSAFFPIDGQGYGNYYNGHNFHFTYELHGEFNYGGGEVFSFHGDDDLFVFINNKLAIDLGGIHPAEAASINLDSIASSHHLTKGQNYPIDFFFAERHTVESNFEITTTMKIVPQDADPEDLNKKITICHVPPGNPKNAHTITISENAWPAHSQHCSHENKGAEVCDQKGPCQAASSNGDTTVEADDFQDVIDYTRGVETTPVKYLALERGDWKLADSQRSVPTVSRLNSGNASLDPTYRAFKDLLVAASEAGAPDLVLMTSNDGMLHAFDLSNGEEVWGWVPAQVLYWDQPATWAGRLVESLWYGQTTLFDATPVIQDVWIDENQDGQEAADGSEWHRIVVVTQGTGGPSVLALDITNPTEPQYLWEQTPDSATTGVGQAVSRAIITNAYDSCSSSAGKAPLALWASGKATPAFTPADNYTMSEADLYFQKIGGDEIPSPDTCYDGVSVNVDPESSVASELDTDGRSERGYIAGGITGIDTNGDGMADVLYYPVSTTYEPPDMGDVDGDGKTGTSDVADPGYTWIYKTVLNPDDPAHPTTTMFYDPFTATGDRPEVFFSATASWMPDGTLGLYWGTGGPDIRNPSEPGYFFGVTDPNPTAAVAGRPITGFGDDGVITLSNGEALTWEPVVSGGVVYFVTYTPDCGTCTTGTSHIYGITYDTGENGIDTDGDGVADAPYYEIDAPVGSFKVSDQGLGFYGTVSSPDAVGAGSISVGTLSLVSHSANTSALAWGEKR